MPKAHLILQINRRRMAKRFLKLITQITISDEKSQAQNDLNLTIFDNGDDAFAAALLTVKNRVQYAVNKQV